MQLFSRNTALVALSLGALTALGACGDNVTVPVAPDSPVVISITPPSATMNIGEKLNFAVQITGGSKTASPTLASCTSSNTAVATAAVSGSACAVTAVAAGNVTVTAAASTGGTAAASVSVAAPAAAISGLAVSPSAASVAVNQKVTIVPTVNKAAAAVAVAYTYASSAATIASVDASGVVTAVAPGVATITVTAAGTGTGFTATTLTGAATVTVTALPSGLTSLTVTPASMNLAIAGTGAIAASATQPSGASAATYTYASSATGVATVSATGVVTAVAAGSAVITVTATSAANTNFAAATLSSAVAVTVAPAPPAPSVAITYVNTPAGAAVDVNNVTGQIQVGTNIVTNGNNVSGLQLYACPVSQATCPTAAQTPVAQQTFGAGGASSGAVEFSVNTAAFAVASDWSASTVNFVNGQTRLVATLTSAGAAATSATVASSVMNFNNVDGWAARHTAPATTATTAGNPWYGGPAAAGRGSITIVPVTYTAGRSVNTATVAIASGATCGAAVTFATGTAKPWTITYGYTTAAGTVANAATNVICTGTSAAADHNVGAITAAIDNSNIAYPATATAADLKTTTAVTPAVVAPSAIRVDYAAPSNGAGYVPTGTLASDSWINSSYTFSSTAAEANVVDAGVGNAAAVYQYTTMPLAATPVWTTVTSGADIAESATDLSNGAYQFRYITSDKLGNANAASSVVAAGTNTFGVDKTVPLIRLTARTDADGTIYSTIPAAGTAADTLYSAEALDERSGFNATAASYSAAKTARATNTGRCWTGAAFAAAAGTIGTSMVTAPVCAFTATGASLDAPLAVDGYRPLNIPFRTVNTTIAGSGDGYYAVAARITDKAGNSTTATSRYILSNPTANTSVATSIATTALTSTYAAAFAGTATDLVETAGSGLRVNYGGADTFGYPATATSAVSFDNVVASTTAAVSNATPFTSGVTLYTNVEKTNGTDQDDGATVNSLTNVAGGIGFYTFGFGGIGSQSAALVSPLAVTGDAVAWGAKVPAMTTFAVVDGAASFNAPAGGLKARAVGGPGLLNAPFTRVDFYAVRGGINEYLGSSTTSFVADNGVSRVFTYTLNAPYANASTGFTSQLVCSTAASAVVGSACATAGATTIVAVGSTGTSGRVLMTRNYVPAN